MTKHSFFNSHFIFATNHGKAVAAQSLFKEILNSSVSELIIDSDSLGTFSGEVERIGSMVDALRNKVRLARELTDERLIITSEGSFGSADPFGAFPQGVEMLMVHDAVTGAEILEQQISLDTNYATESVRDLGSLYRFLERISFGSHALVLYPEGVPLKGNVWKGIIQTNEAEHAFARCYKASPTGGVVVMSDMRAHLNPKRMQSIASCCKLLARRLATLCPKCSSGGFGLVSTIPGLPCGGCGSPTQRARGENHSCSFCKASIERPRGDGRVSADPSECEWCNP